MGIDERMIGNGKYHHDCEPAQCHKKEAESDESAQQPAYSD
jgi:hypothetical protein